MNSMWKCFGSKYTISFFFHVVVVIAFCFIAFLTGIFAMNNSMDLSTKFPVNPDILCKVEISKDNVYYQTIFDNFSPEETLGVGINRHFIDNQLALDNSNYLKYINNESTIYLKITNYHTTLALFVNVSTKNSSKGVFLQANNLENILPYIEESLVADFDIIEICPQVFFNDTDLGLVLSFEIKEKLYNIINQLENTTSSNIATQFDKSIYSNYSTNLITTSLQFNEINENYTHKITVKIGNQIVGCYNLQTVFLNNALQTSLTIKSEDIVGDIEINVCVIEKYYNGINSQSLAGQGTSTSPYLIYSSQDLILLATNVNNGTFAGELFFEQKNDIYFNEETFSYNSALLISDGTNQTSTAPTVSSGRANYGTDGLLYAYTQIGTNSKKFAGNYNGNNFKISGIYVNASSAIKGLFGNISATGIVKNVRIVNSYIATAGYSAGAIAGVNNGTVENCFANIITVGTDYIGGVVGTNNGIIDKCCNVGVILASSCAGGITGITSSNVNERKILNCFNKGLVINSGDYSGGICGRSENNLTLQNCYNTGEISGVNYCGGIIGFCSENTNTISNCYNMANITKTNSAGYSGAICGESYGTVENCYFLNTQTPNMAVGTVLFATITHTYDFSTPTSVDYFYNNTHLNNTLLVALNSFAMQYDNCCLWENGNNNYPVLDL